MGRVERAAVTGDGNKVLGLDVGGRDARRDPRCGQSPTGGGHHARRDVDGGDQSVGRNGPADRHRRQTGATTEVDHPLAGPRGERPLRGAGVLALGRVHPLGLLVPGRSPVVPELALLVVAHHRRPYARGYSWTSSISVPAIDLGWMKATVVPRLPGRGASS